MPETVTVQDTCPVSVCPCVIEEAAVHDAAAIVPVCAEVAGV
jgi:hypothetical protein